LLYKDKKDVDKMEIKISVNKVQIVRPESTVKISRSDLSTNWTIDYVEIDKKTVEYLCIINIDDDIFLSFVIQGLIECDGPQFLKMGNKFIRFNSMVLNKSVKVMMKLLNETQESKTQMNLTTRKLTPVPQK
jgi:hypothetical protein